VPTTWRTALPRRRGRRSPRAGCSTTGRAGGGREPGPDAGPGGAALAPPARRHRVPEVGHARPDAGELRDLRLRARPDDMATIDRLNRDERTGPDRTPSTTCRADDAGGDGPVGGYRGLNPKVGPGSRNIRHRGGHLVGEPVGHRLPGVEEPARSGVVQELFVGCPVASASRVQKAAIAGGGGPPSAPAARRSPRARPAARRAGSPHGGDHPVVTDGQHADGRPDGLAGAADVDGTPSRSMTSIRVSAAETVPSRCRSGG